MREKTKRFLEGAFISTIVSLLSFTIAFQILFHPTYIQNNNIVYLQENESIENILENIAINVSSSHEYKIGWYDCTQFSRQYIKEVGKLGIKAYCVTGYYNDSFSEGRHTWVEVLISNKTYTIDPTNGFLARGEELKFYTVYKKGFCL